MLSYCRSVQPKDAALQAPSAAPQIASFVNDGDQFYYVVIEQHIYCQCISFSKVLFLWFASHYIFKLKYHRYNNDTTMFLQEFVFQLPYTGKKSSNYLPVATEIFISALK